MHSVSRERFSELVTEAVESLPEEFRDFLDEVAIEIQDRATPRQLAEAGVEPGGELLGLYVGHPLTERSVEEHGRMPDVIYIFQKPIERICRSEAELVEQVRVTVLHEIGHHFGMDEDDLDDVGYG